MTMASNGWRRFGMCAAIAAGLALAACGDSSSDDDDDTSVDAGMVQVDAAPPGPSAGLVLATVRNLGDGEDAILLVDADPASAQFGQIVQRVDVGAGTLPHHIYFNHAKSRVYATALGGTFLYEVVMAAGDTPQIMSVEPIDAGENIVGENIYFLEDDSRFYVTFLGGTGGAMDGSVGVFDGDTNQLTTTIQAAPGGADPFVLWPHGISANEDMGMLMVTSTLAPDNSGAGNTVSEIDLATNTVKATHLVAPDEGTFTAPLEVLVLRDGADPYVLVTTQTGDVWIAPYDADGVSGAFTQVIVGADEGYGAALEFYVRETAGGGQELYISYAVPGIVNVYSLDSLPDLPLLRTLEGASGTHHVAFFESDGREVAVLANNLINIDGLNTGTLTVRDVETNELLGEVDLTTSDSLLIEAIESAYGTGYLYHH